MFIFRDLPVEGESAPVRVKRHSANVTLSKRRHDVTRNLGAFLECHTLEPRIRDVTHASVLEKVKH